MATPNKVWLLGADSFTGHHLVPELISQGYSVDKTVVDITSSTEVNNAMQSIKPDYILNLAAISFVPDGVNEMIYATNTLGPQYLLETALRLERPPIHIILVSSANIYGHQLQERLTEDCIPNPVNHYGCSKWAMEQIVKTYSDRLNITITRPFNYTGREQNEKFLIPKIVNHFKSKAETIKLGNINVWRDFSDVRWVCQAYSQLLKTPTQGVDIVNICSGELTSIKEILEMLQAMTGHEIELETDSNLIRAAEIESQCGDNNKLFSICPSLNTAIPIRDTLQWMLDS